MALQWRTRSLEQHVLRQPISLSPCLRARKPSIRKDRSHVQLVSACSSSDPCTTLPNWGDKWDKSRFLQLLRTRHQGHDQPAPGRVYLVGTGPGDPGLLTLRAVQLMRCADVVLYDRLVSDDVLQLIHPGAVMVYVGKTAGYHTASQEEIHQMLLEFASAGATVVRLKGGDPFVFGRGGEEVAYLQSHGIQVLAVPGVTAAAGICAELGIPMTHRGVATSVRFLTGHAREGGECEVDAAVATAGADLASTTLVVYMGLGALPGLVERLVAAGGAPRTPAVAVERGTTAQQRVVYASLEGLVGAAGAAALRSPTLIVIGEVVGLSPGWAAAAAASAAAAGGAGGGGGCAGGAPPARAELPDVVGELLSGRLAAGGSVSSVPGAGQRVAQGGPGAPLGHPVQV